MDFYNYGKIDLPEINFIGEFYLMAEIFNTKINPKFKAGDKVTVSDLKTIYPELNEQTICKITEVNKKISFKTYSLIVEDYYIYQTFFKHKETKDNFLIVKKGTEVT